MMVMANFSLTIVAALIWLSSPVQAFVVMSDPFRQRSTAARSILSSAADAEAIRMPTPSHKRTKAVGIPALLSREDGRHVLNTALLPETEYGSRIEVGRESQGLDRSVVVTASDPRLTLTYGEFPLESLDELVDLALPHVSHATELPTRMLDLGSGCGRLAMYMALTRSSTDGAPWDVHGIEISSVMHDVAVECLDTGAQQGLFTNADIAASSLHLHAGSAADWTEVLSNVDLIFAYSTVFPTRGFSEEWGSMIMSREWSDLLARSCRSGCIVISTDRTLDPDDGWELLDRLDVVNWEVLGSTGYIQRLKHR